MRTRVSVTCAYISFLEVCFDMIQHRWWVNEWNGWLAGWVNEWSEWCWEDNPLHCHVHISHELAWDWTWPSSVRDPLCRVFILRFLRQTVSLENTVLQLFSCYYSLLLSMCAMPNMAVFWSSLTSCFPGMLLTYFLNDFGIVPVAPIITGITFVFTFHVCCISILRSLYFRIFSASLLITFPSPEIATSINIHVPFSLSRIIVSGLLLGIVLSVCTCWFLNMVTLPSWLVSTDSDTCSYQCFLSNCTPVYYYYYRS